MTNKADYVRRQRQTREHSCHWRGCPKQVTPAMWGCRPHWSALPKSLRDKIWRAYRPGQEIDMNPSAEYLAVAREQSCLLQTWDYSDDGAANGHIRSWHLCGGCHNRLLVYFFEESPA